MCLQDQGIDDDDGVVNIVCGHAESVTRTEASTDYKGYTTCPRDQRHQLKQQGINDGHGESSTTTEASEEEDEHKHYNNEN